MSHLSVDVAPAAQQDFDLEEQVHHFLDMKKKYIYIILPKMKANVKSYSLHKFVTIVNGEQKRNAYHKQL